MKVMLYLRVNLNAMYNIDESSSAQLSSFSSLVHPYFSSYGQ